MDKTKSNRGLVEGHLEFLAGAASSNDYSGVIKWIKENLLNENSNTKPVIINSFFDAQKEFIRNRIFAAHLDKIRSFFDAIDNEDFDKSSIRYKKLKLNQCKVLADAIKAAEEFLQGRDDICKGLSDLLKAKQDELKDLDLEEREKNFRDKSLSTSIDEALSAIQVSSVSSSKSK
ncbi:MAG: hypothetical protein LBE46_00625 [Wolbachia pipientis]|jgi:hypothetical protein|nr:hypothetical protein [Wolbachia pipientis]